jgi:uncharacterized secreted protein with C-terminal beta-propeller domain
VGVTAPFPPDIDGPRPLPGALRNRLLSEMADAAALDRLRNADVARPVPPETLARLAAAVGLGPGLPARLRRRLDRSLVSPRRRSVPLAVAVSITAVLGLLALPRVGDDPGQDATPAPRVKGETVERFASGPLSLPGERAPSTEAPPTTAPEDPAPKSEDVPALYPFKSGEEALAFMRSSAERSVGPYGLPDFRFGGGTGAGGFGVGGGSATGVAGATPTDSADSTVSPSGTNVQEPGVDEPDIVKHADGRILTLFQGRLRWLIPGEGAPTVAGELDLGADEDADAGMLVVGNRAVVMWTEWSARSEHTRIVTVALDGPSAMRRVSDLRLEGRYVTSRAVEGAVRVVSTRARPRLDFTRPEEAGRRAADASTERNRKVVRRSVLNEWIPRLFGAGAGTSRPVSPPSRIFAPPVGSGFAVTTVLTLDIEAGSVADTATVFADTDIVYASTANLYLATRRWREVEGQVSAGDTATEIHQFDLSDPGRATYVASGAVPGRLPGRGGTRLAQWALSEHDGHLRVVTHVGAMFGGGDNVVSVLRTDRATGTLIPTGTVAGIGKGEQLFGIRLMGDRGYVVTFEQVDPLWVLDLSEPTAPRVLGHLEVPGFSWYLHPVGPDRLVGIGQSGDWRAQASLFDIADPGHPRRLDTLTLGRRNSVSEVERDHRAFTWWGATSVAVVPVTDGASSGARMIGVTRDALRERPRISHDVPGEDECVFRVRRSLVIGPSVYTFSEGGVWVHDLDEVELRGVRRYEGVEGPRGCVGPDPEPDPGAPTTTTTAPSTTTTTAPSTTTTTTTTTTTGPIPPLG